MNLKKIKNIVHHNLGRIITTNSNFRRGFFELKNSGNFQTMANTADRLVKASKAYYKYIYGEPFPDSISKIGVTKTFAFSNELESELNWMLLSVRKFRAELAIFLQYKKEFEKYFLLGEYEEAEKVLGYCQSEFGYSIWYLSSRMLLHEYAGESEKAKILMSDVLKENKDGAFTASLINFLSQKVEKKLSASKFDTDLKTALNNPKSNLSKSNRDFYEFHLNFFESKEITELPDIISFSFYNPLPDRYLTFRRIVHYCFCKGVSLDIVLNAMIYADRKLQDGFFDPIFLFTCPEHVKVGYFDQSYLNVIDLFYSGLYQEALLAARQHIIANPSDFTIINLYSRSLAFLQKEFEPPVNKKCTVNEIAENIYRIYRRKSQPTEALYNIYQFSKNLDSFDLNYQLVSFLKKEQNLPDRGEYFIFTMPKADPKFLDLFGKSPDKAVEMIQVLKSHFGQSVSIAYTEGMINGNFEAVQAISEDKTLIDRAVYQFNAGNWDESLSLFNKIYTTRQDIPPICESAINYIFRIFLEKGQLNDCISWYVDNYIKNPYSVFKIDASGAHRMLKKQRFKNISIDISLPIFIALVSRDENEKSFIIELYCKTKNAKLPSELIGKKILPNDAYSKLFFYKSCGNETLKHYRHIDTTKKRLEERILICDYLAASFPVEAPTYIRELDLLTNELIIHEGTVKLDDSKIYANDNAILSNDLEEYKGLYNRYITIAGLHLRDIQILTVNKNELRYLNKKNEVDYSQTDIEYSSQAHFDAFYDLFDEIRDKFLFSRFGIVAYLSTRIRHGVLLGELRPELEKHKLIFFKNKLNNSYDPDPYWVNTSNLPERLQGILFSIIIDFSDEVDNFISNLIKENIQITLDKEQPQAWFDYHFSYDHLSGYSVTLFYEEGYENFCKKVMEILWDRTDQILSGIRERLQGDVKIKFVDILNNFEARLKQQIGAYWLPEIFTSLNACSTNLQNKIDKISAWFKRSGKAHADFDIASLIQIICTSVNKSHPLKELVRDIQCDCPYLFRGEFYEHFKDFLRILIDNMLRHSVKNTVVCKIKFVDKGDFIELMLENNNAGDQSDVTVVEDGNHYFQIDSVKLITEGKSGLIKARKTLKDDLRDTRNELYIFQHDGVFRATAIIHHKNIIA
jgi:hypothetical protein